MASPYVLSNTALQYLNGTLTSRFRLYVAVYNPVAISVSSQDLAQDIYHQLTVVPNADLLATAVAPYAPQPNLGSNRIAFVGEPLLFDGSRSTQRGNLPAIGHTWVATGAPTTQTYHGPHTTWGSQLQCTWNTPGLYSVSLTVSDRFGHSTTGIRQVMVYANRATAPSGIIGLTSISGSIGSGGYTGSLTTTARMSSILGPGTIPAGSYQPIVILAETEYEVAPGSWVLPQTGPYGAFVPGQWYNDPRIVFAGYIQGASADENADYDTITYQLATPDMVLRQAGIHNIGYYHTKYNARNSQGIPTSLSPAVGAQGQLVADLTSEDVYRSLLLDHSTFGTQHDVFLWRDYLPVPTLASQLYYLTYSTLTANEGTIWDALTLLANNEFASVWCERSGAVCIGPSYDMRGYELLSTPTIYPPIAMSQVVPLATELNNNATLGARLVYQECLFGPNPLPQAQETPGGYSRPLGSLTGPPIAYHLSDIPVKDPGASAPPEGTLLPQVVANWPQDISVRPLATTIAENYTERDGFVKVVAQLVTGASMWAAWFPLGMFNCNGLTTTRIPAGTWQVTDTILLADITAASGSTPRILSWHYLWEMARRSYYAHNKLYTLTASLGAFPWAGLNDLCLVTRQRVLDGPRLSGVPFAITGVSHSINLDQQHWTTQLQGGQVSSYNLGPTPVAPCPIPPLA